MITLFATPKDFTGIFKTIQINALRSWRQLSPEIQIIILGNSEGSGRIAAELEAEYVPDVRCSKEGTPILSDLFKQAEKRAKFPLMTFINADIILPENFLEGVFITTQRFKKFLMVGHRWDLDVQHEIDFNNQIEKSIFWEMAAGKCQKHPCTGIDYFVFNKGLWKSLPDFIIGRPGYDNWLIWNIRRRMLPVIDASEYINVIHQIHDYNFHNVTNSKDVRTGNEAKTNIKLHKEKLLNILDANYKIINSEIIKKTAPDEISRFWHRLPSVFPEFTLPIKLIRRLKFRLDR